MAITITRPLHQPLAALALLGLLSLTSCPKKEPATAPSGNANAGAAAGRKIPVTWGIDIKSTDGELDAFVERAVEHCAAGNYDEYRLLWRYDHRPTNRKRFKRMWSVVESVEIKLLKEIRYRSPDGTVHAGDRPTYAFHAFVKVDAEAVDGSDADIQDRDLVLLVVNENDRWMFVPAPDGVKRRILGGHGNPPPASQPTTRNSDTPQPDPSGHD